MDELLNTLEKVLKKIKNHRNLYNTNEEAVRNQIINPILRGLGWDPENPEFVHHNELSEEGKKPDYSLFKDGKKVLFIEAKKLSVDINDKDAIKQLSQYCYDAGTKFGLLTNGVSWRFFQSFQEDTTYPERTIWKIDLENQDLAASVLYFNRITHNNIEKIEQTIKENKVFTEIWESLLDKPKDIVKELLPIFTKRIHETYPESKFEDQVIEDFMVEEITKILSRKEEIAIPASYPSETIPIIKSNLRRMKIGNTSFDIKNSNEILVNTAEWLIRERKLGKGDCPIVIGPKRILVNIEPKHRFGADFVQPKKLSNGLYIEVNYSTPSCISNSKWLLGKFSNSTDLSVS